VIFSFLQIKNTTGATCSFYF